MWQGVIVNDREVPVLDPKDLQIEAWPNRTDIGGQHVGLTRCGVKVTHLPTNTIACVDHCRSQHANRTIAIDMIVSAITHPMFR